MVHNPIADNDPPDIYLGPLPHIVVGIDEDCQIGDILSGVGLTRYEKFTAFVLRELLKEIDDCVQTIVGSGGIIVNVLGVSVDGISYSGW